jgi:vesicle coat complex subunit
MLIDVQVQLALLTATVKLFIRRPTAASSLLPKVLKMATEEADNPDLRDRVCPFQLAHDHNANPIGVHVLATVDVEPNCS